MTLRECTQFFDQFCPSPNLLPHFSLGDIICVILYGMLREWRSLSSYSCFLLKGAVGLPTGDYVLSILGCGSLPFGLERACQKRVRKVSVPVCQESLGCLFNKRKHNKFVRKVMDCSLNHHLKVVLLKSWMEKFYLLGWGGRGQIWEEASQNIFWVCLKRTIS